MNISSLKKQSDKMRAQIEALEIERGRDQAAIDAIQIPDLYSFVKEAWHVIEPGTPFVDGRHIEALCMHLEAVTDRRIKRLLINMPPRFAKSSIVSVLWPVWTWLVRPDHKWLCASYALSLSIRDNRKCRLLIQSPWFQQKYGVLFKLTADQHAKIHFENTARGSRQACSTGSSVTGSGGDTLLIDDAHSIDDKTSDVKREAALEWFKSTWSTRLNDAQTGAMVVVGQRIHAVDVSGMILSDESGEAWTHLNLAAEYEPENRCETYIDGELFWQDWRTESGELLWPERFPAHIIEIAKRKHGAMGYAALFQQRPMPAEGGQFKQQWFRYFTIEGEYYALGRGNGIKHVRVDACQCFATSDLAISTKQTADYTCLCVWAITPDRELLLLQCIHDRIDNPGQQKAIIALYQRYQPDFIQIESIAYQLSLVQQLRQQGLPIKEYRPVKDKVARASSASVYYEGEQVFHPKSAPWLQEWEEELLLFPRARNDDRVDNASMACEHLAKPRQIGGMMLTSDEEIAYDPYADDEDYPGPNDPHAVFWR